MLSKGFLLDTCPVDSYIKVVSHGKGKFGRILGEIYELDNDEVSINQQMCDEAYAVPYFGQSKGELETLHAANRDILIEKGLI